MILDLRGSQVPIESSSPLPPFTLLHGDFFFLIWTKITGAKWDFEVKEHLVEENIHLPVPTTKQLQAFCGEGVLMQFSLPVVHWEIVVPENIILIPNQKSTTFSDEFFLGLCIPVKTVDGNVSLSIS